MTGSVPKIMLIGYQDTRSGGGSLRVLETIAKSLPAVGFEVEILFAYGEKGSVSRDCGCPVHLIKAKGPHDLMAWRRVRRLIRERRPSILQFVDNVNWLLLATQGLKLIKLTYAHGCIIYNNKKHQKKLSQWLSSRLSFGTITISYGAKRALVHQGVRDSNRCWVVQNSVDQSFTALPTSKMDRKIDLDRPVIKIGMACLLTEMKGIFDALELLRLLPNNWHLVIAGVGPSQEKFKERILENGLTDRVTLLGRVQKMTSFYDSVDYYLFLSRYESFGLVLAEAMYSGVPIIGLRGDGEYAESEYPLIDSHVALMPLRRDPFDYQASPAREELQKLVEQLLDLENNPNKRLEMVENARERITSGFLPHHQAHRLAGVYRSLL